MQSTSGISNLPEIQQENEGSTSKPTLSNLGVIRRLFTKEFVNPEESFAWTIRNAVLYNSDGTEKFRQDNVEVPKDWSDRATAMVAKHYFRGTLGSEQREYSVKQVAVRVANAIGDAAVKQGLLTQEERFIFVDELKYIVYSQKAAFNSPVWYNVGVEESPQSSACFILNVEDTLLGKNGEFNEDSIIGTVKKEARIFKYGSGSGLNLSKLREAQAPMSGGGYSSGVLSWMRTLDSNAGSIKSGGRTRRAACMRILDADHPDIMGFIGLKAHEEDKMAALVRAGYDSSLGGEAEQTVTGQNANNSVRVTDAFMAKISGMNTNDMWILKTRAAHNGGKDVKTKASEVFNAINECAHKCADPGMQFHDTINRMHTCKASGEIDGSNPCAEYMFLSDTACNLASINLCNVSKTPFGMPELDELSQVIDIMFTAQEALISFSDYPTPQIKKMSNNFRTLGLGYGNLGTLLMTNGIPYDSDEGRRIAGSLASFMTARAYENSASFAKILGPFPEFEKNKTSVCEVLKSHIENTQDLLDFPNWPAVPKHLNGMAFKPTEYIRAMAEAAINCWNYAYKASVVGKGIRNAQATVLAPTGTISFLMDFDTTGVEPASGLVSYKTMVDGSMEQMAFRPIGLALLEVDPSLKKLQLEDIKAYVGKKGHLEGAPHIQLTQAQMKVFECAFPSMEGKEKILRPEGHVLMMAAIQPFISGAISKTVNLPASASVQDFRDIHLLSWMTGVKAIATYRYGSKNIQPITSGEKENEVRKEAWGQRQRLPDDVKSFRHKFTIAGNCSGFIHMGEDADGNLREIFIDVAKTGGTLRGFADAVGIALSHCLQLGQPLSEIVNKHMWSEFAPSGFTSNPQIPSCTSILDYVAKLIATRYLGHDYSRALLSKTVPEKPVSTVEVGAEGVCPSCSGLLQRSGTCNVCTKCGETTGCS